MIKSKEIRSSILKRYVTVSAKTVLNGILIFGIMGKTNLKY